MNKSINRKYFINGIGTSIALPHLHSLHGESSLIHHNNKMIFLSFGWGVTKETWFPQKDDTGFSYKLPEGLKALSKHKKDFSLILGTEHQFNKAGHSGSTLFLTGANPYGVPGKSFSNTISVDQIAAESWGAQTRYRSLQFDCKNAQTSGHGPGLSLSWNRSGKPMAGLQDPFLVYNKLFGNEKMSIEEKRDIIRRKNSSMDAIMMDVKSLKKELNHQDKDKLDEYLESIREIELQLSREEDWLEKPKPKAPFKEPKQGLQGYQEIKLMYDLMVAAFQTNVTRVISYRQPVETLLQSLNVDITSHNMSHYGQGSRFTISKLRDHKQCELLSYLIDKLKKTKNEMGVSLFDQTTLVYGSNISHGHSLRNCPVIVAGNRNIFKHGAHHALEQRTPLCNLWLTLLKANGLNVNKFGDSNGHIEKLLNKSI